MPIRLEQMDSSVARTLVLRFNVPNAVTMVRIALAVVIAWLLIQGEQRKSYWWAFYSLSLGLPMG